MLATDELNNLTQQHGYANIEDAAIKQLKLSLLGKIAKYQAEDEYYKRKYNNDYNTIIETNNIEIFEKEDDLLEWKFAIESLNKCKAQIKSIS